MNASAAILLALTLCLAVAPAASAAALPDAVEPAQARDCAPFLRIVCVVVCLVSPPLCNITASPVG